MGRTPAPAKTYQDTLKVTPIQMHIAGQVSRKYNWRARRFEDWEDVRQTAYMLLCMILREGKLEDPLGTHGLAFMLNYDLFDWYREKGRVTRGTLMGAPEDRVFRDVATKSLDAPMKSYHIGDAEDADFTFHGKLQAPPDNPVNFVDRDTLREGIAQLLTERERKVISGRYIEDRTDEEIGAELGVTASRISQLATRALHKLELWMDKSEENVPAQSIIKMYAPPPPRRVNGQEGELSAREVQVLQLKAEGRDTNECAKVMGISPETIKSHLRHIRGHFGMGHLGISAAVAEGFRRGILT